MKFKIKLAYENNFGVENIEVAAPTYLNIFIIVVLLTNWIFMDWRDLRDKAIEEFNKGVKALWHYESK